MIHDSQIHFRISFGTHFKTKFYAMRIILNELFCQQIWRSDIRKVKEPNRTKKLREYCNKLVQENNKKLNDQDRIKVLNGIKYFLKDYKETQIEIEDENGK